MAQGQKTLARDFPEACVFKDCMSCVPPAYQADARESGSPPPYWATEAACVQHKTWCKLKREVDLAVFGAPCVDDSSMGSNKKDEGASRQAPMLESNNVFCYIWFYMPFIVCFHVLSRFSNLVTL